MQYLTPSDAYHVKPYRQAITDKSLDKFMNNTHTHNQGTYKNNKNGGEDNGKEVYLNYERKVKSRSKS